MHRAPILDRMVLWLPDKASKGVSMLTFKRVFCLTYFYIEVEVHTVAGVLVHLSL